LVALTRLVDAGELRPAVGEVLPLAEARTAFEHSDEPGRHGKIVLRVA
jgi:NADPH:quinone reductase-like Zn-dependent oxidoreductase